MDLIKKIEKKLNERKEKKLYRTLKNIKILNPPYIEINGKKYVNFSSNDYLGLSFKNPMLNNIPFTGSGASRLITGNSNFYTKLEKDLSKWMGKPCLIYNSGYQINIGILPIITGKKDLIIADKLIHRSLIEGIKLSPAKFLRFKHNDIQELEKILLKNKEKYENIFVVIESIYSMTGDRCPLEDIIKLKKRYKFYIYIDEAHSIGVLGENGKGLCEELGYFEKIDFFIGTLGKAFGANGAFIAADKIIIDYLINFSPSFIYTTALSPLLLSKIHNSLQIISSKEGKKLRKKLRKKVTYFRKKISDIITTYGKDHIIPLVIGNIDKLLKIQNYLQNKGFYVIGIRPPTVPKGQELIRIGLNVYHSTEIIDNFTETLQKALHS